MLLSRACARWLIPARAGKTWVSGWFDSGLWAHPRSRGENGPFHDGSMDVRGSSPLARGKLAALTMLRASSGLIPARAGKTTAPTGPSTQRPAHPRSRGENPYTASPEQDPKWLIPARAGKTWRGERRPPWCPAHPRSRGENGGATGLGTSPFGSSPLARGKHRPSRALRSRRRLIPARAGKTGCCWHCGGPFGAHPRSRGENFKGMGQSIAQEGSSPLARGKPRPAGIGTLAQGLIPARAGKTRTPRPEA